MAAVSSIILGAGLALSAAGTGISYMGQQKAQKGQEEALQYQQQIEAKRQQQMELDAARRKRELIRQQLAARSQALATATAQGAAGEGGSALPGAYGSISGRTNVNTLGINQNLEIGRDIFEANQGMLGAYQTVAAGRSMETMGAGLGSLGNALLRNEGVLTRIGTYFGGGSRLDPGVSAFNAGGSRGKIY